MPHGTVTLASARLPLGHCQCPGDCRAGSLTGSDSEGRTLWQAQPEVQDACGSPWGRMRRFLRRSLASAP